MKTGTILVGVVAVILLALFGFYMIDVDQTQEGQLPDVDVSVEGGQAPEYDAEVGSIGVTEEETTVTVPDIDVTTEEETVTVPSLEITPPEENN